MKIDEIIVVTGCDSGHFDLAEDFIVSFRKAYGDRYKTGFVKFDTQPLTNVLSSLFDIKVDCSSGFASFDPSSGYYAAFQRLKVRLPDLFPGFQTYCWIDSDCWFQDSQSIPRITKGANNCDICIHPEFDTHYWRYATPNPRTEKIYKANYASELDSVLLKLPMVNAGVFAMAAKSKLWSLWDAELSSLVRRFQQGENVYLSDQIPLHKIIYSQNLQIHPLRAADNWQLYACQPLIRFWDETVRMPTEPHELIGVMHLAGDSKNEYFTSQNGLSHRFRYRDLQSLFESQRAGGLRGVPQRLRRLQKQVFPGKFRYPHTHDGRS